jgi:hypothetical protein
VTAETLVLITISEAAAVLGLKSRGSVYRKVRNGELKAVTGPDGKEMLERDGLEARWAGITRSRSDSPRPAREPKPLRPAAERKAKVIDQAPDAVVILPVGDDDLPEYSVSRARSEFERANLLELERRLKEGQLVERKKVEATWAAMVTAAKTKLLAVPSRSKQRIPHLSLEEVEIITLLVREALEDLAGGEAEE